MSRSSRPAASVSDLAELLRVKILILSDELVVGALIAEWARMQHHEVTAVQDADAAVQSIASARYDVFLVDLPGTGATRRELLARIRGTHPAPPVIVIMFVSDIVRMAKVERLGVTGVIEKPVTFASLAQALGRLTPTIR